MPLMKDMQKLPLSSDMLNLNKFRSLNKMGEDVYTQAFILISNLLSSA